MPSSLPRASLVCNRWRSVATAAAFRRRFRIHHRKPPIIGVFQDNPRGPEFVPLLDPPDRIPSERFSLDLGVNDETWKVFWRVLGVRHGRVLLIDRKNNLLLVYEPVSGDAHHIPIPPEFIRDGYTGANAAVFCAAGDDHVHGDCHLSPFKVVLVGTANHAMVAIARVYSSETGIWGDLVSPAEPFVARSVTFHPSTLSGNALYWFLNGATERGILKFDLENQSLTVISYLPAVLDVFSYSKIWITRAPDVGLGLAILSYPHFQLWDCIVDCHGPATWVMRKTINMDDMFGSKADKIQLAGYAEDADAIFLSNIEASSSGYVLVVKVHLEF